DSWDSGQAGFRADWGTAAGAFTLQGDAYRGTIDSASAGDIRISGGNLLARWARQLAGGDRVQAQAYLDNTGREMPGTFEERLNRELFVPGQPPFSVLAGGPDFRSEISKVLELGYRAQPSRRASYSVTLFHSVHDHLRSVEPGPAGPVIGNEMEGKTDGIEA